MDIIKKTPPSKNDFAQWLKKEEAEKKSGDEKLKYQTYRFGQTFDIDKDDMEPLINKQAFKNKFHKPQNSSNDNNKKMVSGGSENYQPQNDFLKNKNKRKSKILIWSFLIFLFGCSLGGGYLYVKKGLDTQKKVLGMSRDVYTDVNLAIESAKRQDFALSADKFKQAYANFEKMSESLKGLGSGVINISRFIPGASRLSSGYHLTEAGKQLALAGEKISTVANTIDELKNKASNQEDDRGVSILEIFKMLEKDLREVNGYLLAAQDNLDKIKIEDIPRENQSEIIALKTKLPIIIGVVDDFFNNSHIMTDFLGANGSRKYLFLFQNNQEMRPTGGFIGSYGVLDIDGGGRIRNFFIDGIFNPDGQLLDKVIPPKPIQKISAAWSLHDSNWFADFPISAQKAILFYERTGGPTVDGVITLTPTVMQKLLEITGPIEMSEYGVTLTKDNFIENVQYEVEVDYDKEENRPKKILSDLTPMILDRLSQSKDAKTVLSTMDVLSEALKEKHILLYFSNSELQEIISNLGWSGEILKAQDDYLSVINTNINGFKTDGVVKEKISHEVNIYSNGEIVDVVSINRKHNGGDTNYEWWNKVNSDYMRVYVPKGAELLEVEGQTREINDDVLDYQSLNYEVDTDVRNEESQMKIDDKTGTRVYIENDKTVFANWVYVSPKEEVTIKYKYKLPFKFSGDIRSYSLLAQKQSGSLGSDFDLIINYPKDWRVEWKNEGLGDCDLTDKNFDRICFLGDLKTDKFIGSVFTDK